MKISSIFKPEHLKFCALSLALMASMTSFGSGGGLSKINAERPSGESEESSAHGGSGSSGGSARKSSGSVRYNTLQPPRQLMGNLNVAAFNAAKGKSSYNQAGKYCAAGVRESLNALFGKSVGNGPNAKDWNIGTLQKWRSGNACYKAASSQGNTYQNFDVRVLQPRAGGPSKFGHIEIFYEGTWYSDHSQVGSLFDVTESYSRANLFRVSPCSSSATIWECFQGMSYAVWKLVSPNAEAQSSNTQSTGTKEKESVANIGQQKDSSGTLWTLKRTSAPSYVLYTLTKNVKGKESVVAGPNTSFYFMLMDLKDKSVALELSKQALNVAIKESGKEDIQKMILAKTAFTELQRETYLELGFKLPAEYQILPHK